MKTKFVSLIIICLISNLVLLVPIAKAQGSFVVDYFTLQSDRDCDIRQDAPDSNQICSVSNDEDVRSLGSPDRNKRTFVHFNPLPTSTERREVVNASLSMFIVFHQGSGIRTYESSRVSGTWTETGLTWNNQPSAGLDNSSTSVTLSADINYWKSFDVSAIVRSWVENGTSDDGIRIKDSQESSGTTSNATIFYSREGVEKPILHVNTTGLGNTFVSGLIAFVYVSLLVFMVIGGFYIATVIRGKRK